MTFSSRGRNLVFAGMVIGALSGCASTQATARPAAPGAASAQAQARSPETPTQRCRRERRTRVQDCIIESIAASCRERNQGNEDGFYSCVSEGLAVPQAAAPPQIRQASITISQGDEVFSMRSGSPVVLDVARLEAATIDANGAAFTYTIERLVTAAPEQRVRVEQAEVRFNFNGTTSGEVWKLRTLPVWNLRVQGAGSGQAAVSFETNDPAVLVGQPAPAAGQARPGVQGQKKK